MFKIIKTMKSQWKAVIVVVLLLFVQAICDLSLPNYTSQLIDVGIQNSGVEYATPTVIRAEQFEKVQMLSLIHIFICPCRRPHWRIG